MLFVLLADKSNLNTRRNVCAFTFRSYRQPPTHHRRGTSLSTTHAPWLPLHQPHFIAAALINKLVEGERKWQVRERLRWTRKQEQQTASALSETGRRRSRCQGGTCTVTVYSDCDLCVCRRRCQSRGKLNFCIFCNEIFYWILLLSNLWHTCKLDFEFRLHFCLCFWDTSA